ncbi:hypothetical protein [Terasakiella pusilla]|uniref:hypothetical protein n=1 Tax=Terasakiella pusilla TaxID=64973 RepID=UPI003AA950AA
MGHKLDDKFLNSKATMLRMDYEAERNGKQAQWYGAAVTGAGQEMDFYPTITPTPTVFCKTFVFDMLRGLNNSLHHDGAWVCLMLNPVADESNIQAFEADYQKYVFFWMDEDGDIHVPVEIEDKIANILAAGPDVWIEQCELAWLAWQELNRTLDARPNETFKRAMGERPAS